MSGETSRSHTQPNVLKGDAFSPCLIEPFSLKTSKDKKKQKQRTNLK